MGRVGLWDPLDAHSAAYGQSLVGRDMGQRMLQQHAAIDGQGDPNEAYARQKEQQQTAHEQGLQMAEQQRRSFDSDTAREAQKEKYGVLRGLLGGGMMGGGMGGQRIASRMRGDIPASQRGQRY